MEGMDPQPAMNRAGHSVDRAARKTADHPVVVLLARVGFVVLGVLHILIGWICLRIATGSGTEEASNSGALQTIAQAPGGRVMLWVAAVALVALGLWRLSQIFSGEGLKDRAKGGVMAVVYLSLAWTTATFARGGSSSDGETASDVTATVLAQPAGMVLVILAGLIVLGVGVFNIYRGLSRSFREELVAGGRQLSPAVVGAGVAGYTARGIAFAILGVLVMWGAWTHDPEKASGLDQALRTLGEQPAGAFALIVVGVGLALYGVYSIARARYLRM